MKYVITGGAGNISAPLTKKLLAAGHNVTVIGRTEAHLTDLQKAGATLAIGSVEDVSFLAESFRGADAVYIMVPPKYDAPNPKAHIENIGKGYTAAIKASGVKKVVNLSSIGADLEEGCGPITGLHRGELSLNSLTDVDILHLRPAYFYLNLLANIGLIKAAGIIGGNYSIPTGKFPIVHPKDIAEAAAEQLLSLSFKGHSALYISSDETSTDSIAQTLGSALEIPSLPWVKFSNEDALNGMLQAGLPKPISEDYVEMGIAMDSGEAFEDYWKNKPYRGKIKLEEFAKEFAMIYDVS